MDTIRLRDGSNYTFPERRTPPLNCSATSPTQSKATKAASETGSTSCKYTPTFKAAAGNTTQKQSLKYAGCGTPPRTCR